jgi:hypothetical protein
MSRMASYSEFALTRWPLCSDHLSVWILVGPFFFSVWILLVFHWILFGYELASLDITFSLFAKTLFGRDGEKPKLFIDLSSTYLSMRLRLSLFVSIGSQGYVSLSLESVKG